MILHQSGYKNNPAKREGYRLRQITSPKNPVFLWRRFAKMGPFSSFWAHVVKVLPDSLATIYDGHQGFKACDVSACDWPLFQIPYGNSLRLGVGDFAPGAFANVSADIDDEDLVSHVDLAFERNISL